MANCNHTESEHRVKLHSIQHEPHVDIPQQQQNNVHTSISIIVTKLYQSGVIPMLLFLNNKKTMPMSVSKLDQSTTGNQRNNRP